MLGTNDCKTIFGASAEIIGKGIVRLLEQINQYADKMKVLVISPIYLGEKVWQDGYDQEFSPESVEVSKKLEPVYEKVAGKYGKRFMRAADYASPSEADQEHMDGQSHLFFRKDNNPLSVNGISCITGFSVKGAYQDKTTDFLLSFGCNFCNGFSGD